MWVRAAFCVFILLLPALVSGKDSVIQTNDLSMADARAAISAHLSAKRFAQAEWGIKVVVLRSGTVLFETNAQKLLKPASNAKLYTGALALDMLGPDARIKTSIYASQPVEPDGTLRGDLIVYGRGDPCFAARFHDGQYSNLLGGLVQIVKAAGIKRIEGGVVGDATYFTGPAFGASWAWDDLEYYYGAEFSALTFQDNVVDLFIKPGSPGQPCVVAQKPESPAYLTLINRTRTGPEKSRAALSIFRPLGEDRVYISGSLPQKYGTWIDATTVPNPALWFISALKESLEAESIHVLGKLLRTRSWPEDERTDVSRLRLLGETQSAPVSVIVEKMMKASQNLYAQLLLLQAGERSRGAGEGNATSEDLGVKCLKDLANRAGIPAGEMQLEEGSGLSRGGLVSPRATVQLLRFMAGHKEAKYFRMSLPEAGADGTLRNRLPDLKGNLRAKTGSLRFVSSLSGYMSSRSGEELAFSIMLNAYNGQGAEEIDVIPRILARIAEREAPAANRTK